MGWREILRGEEPGPIRSFIENDGDKGHFGEFKTNFALSNNNIQGHNVFMQNLYIPYKGKTAEVDSLIIHEKGLFVFESKNYGGWIFGSREDLHENFHENVPRHQKGPRKPYQQNSLQQT